jgi:hypothetical protein
MNYKDFLGIVLKKGKEKINLIINVQKY